MLAKIEIRSYRVFEHFALSFRNGLNVVVGDNDCGKTTLLEAVSLAAYRAARRQTARALTRSSSRGWMTVEDLYILHGVKFDASEMLGRVAVRFGTEG